MPLLFKWFLDLSVERGQIHRIVFLKRSKRLLDGDKATVLLRDACPWRLFSADHFTFDGTLLEA